MSLPRKRTLTTISPLAELVLGVLVAALLTAVAGAFLPSMAPHALWAFFGAVALIAFVWFLRLARRR